MILTCWDPFVLNSVLGIFFIALSSMSLINWLSMFLQNLTKSSTQIIKQDREEVRVLWCAVRALWVVILPWIGSLYGRLTHYESLQKRWPVGSWVLWSSRNGFETPALSLTNGVALNKFIKISHQQTAHLWQYFLPRFWGQIEWGNGYELWTSAWHMFVTHQYHPSSLPHLVCLQLIYKDITDSRFTTESKNSVIY